MVDAIILAGDTPKDTDLKLLTKVNCKSLIPIAGKPMVEYVVESLAAEKRIGRVAVVGPVNELAFLRDHCQKVELAQHSESILQNVVAGIDLLGNPDKVLVVTADIPMLTTQAVADFLNQAGATDADFYYSVVRREDNDRKYPGVRRTYVRLKNGTFTGGNIFMARSRYVSAKMDLVDKMIALRKEPLKMVKLLGWGFVLKFLLGVLTINELESHISGLLGIKGVAVISPYAEVGTDVDKPSDLELARSILPYKVHA
ncbi:MAG: NTP transferase domain-containing protein [Bacillota bacterium]